MPTDKLEKPFQFECYDCEKPLGLLFEKQDGLWILRFLRCTCGFEVEVNQPGIGYDLSGILSQKPSQVASVVDESQRIILRKSQYGNWRVRAKGKWM